MADDREVCVHLLPALAPPEQLAGGVAVAIDVLRASTTLVYALAAGCTAVFPCAEVEEAQAMADRLPAGKSLLAGERGGVPIAGFDLGNSPTKFTGKVCGGLSVVFTTSNGTRALLRCAAAARTLVGAFVNYSAVCEQLKHEKRPIHLVCSGTDGSVTLEDALLAGAFVDFLSDLGGVHLNDGARLAWDCFETHGRCLQAALELSQGGAMLKRLGFGEDIEAAAQVDEFALVPELRRDPLRVEVGSVGIVKSYWSR